VVGLANVRSGQTPRPSLQSNFRNTALETWKFHGVPKNPSAWLTIAKHRALDILLPVVGHILQ
jgi:hypothetical protein